MCQISFRVTLSSLYVIFWHLSTYALQLQLSHLYPSYLPPKIPLPSLTDHALFPHVIKAFKSHITRQSTMYLTRLEQMEQAESGWRSTADELTREFHRLSQRVNEMNAIHATPRENRIPGQTVVNPEVEFERQLFSPQANAEVSHICGFVMRTKRRVNTESHICARLLLLLVRFLSFCCFFSLQRQSKLQLVKDAHSRLNQFFAKAEQQKGNKQNQAEDGYCGE